jgi:hypothetical protein
MNSQVDAIARAVLYEGYLLYPYRPSALKNQQRWNFGVLYPPSWATKQTGTDRSYFQMECMAVCSGDATLDISLRFLQIVQRTAGERTWQEAIEQRVAIDSLDFMDLSAAVYTHSFSFEGGATGQRIDGQVEISAAQIRERGFRLTVRVSNISDCLAASRDGALMRSLASAHAVLCIHDGEFVSQTDPPEEWREPVAACQNIGVWPVLVGESGTRDTVLGSPIILYDYPQVAPESKDELFDATEIDEILILRILTLTDAEKEEMRRSDERARRILERLENSPPEHLLQLHGTIRGMRPPQGDAWSSWDTVAGMPAGSAEVSGVGLHKGDRVRLRPRKRADIFDTLLDGKIAIIEAVEEDFEGNIHFAVVLEDDPGRDLGEMRQAGHRFFFSREEVEPAEPVRTERV